MKRLQLLEIHDQPWCPASLRDTLTTFLQFVIRWGRLYDGAVPLLARALERAGVRAVVDLCSGGGGPWPDLRSRLAAAGLSIDVLLTDKYPNVAAGQSLRYHPAAVDAAAVPPELTGFRTMFTSFHHFAPGPARAILEDAVRRRQGIGVFELTHRSVLGIAWICLSPLGILLSMPFVRPFRWWHLFWTYVIPLFPLMEAFDGVVSCLRTYTPRELRALTAELGGEGGAGDYVWEIGEQRSRWSSVPMTYCIGYPKPASPSPSPVPGAPGAGS